MDRTLFYGSPNRLMRFVWADEVTATIYSMANTVFMLEKEIKAGKTRKKVSINCYMDFKKEAEKKILTLLNKVILDILCEDINFVFVKKKIKKKPRLSLSEKYDTLCLFSGGIDSTIGILETKKHYKKVLGIYVAHQDLPKVTKKIGDIHRDLLISREIEYLKLIAPAMGKGYSQIRGFLYILYASIVLYFVNGKKIIVSECGVTMYQPKFAPLDTITYTTNPLVLRNAKNIVELIIQKKIEIVTPFSDFTKSEIMNLAKDDKILSKTHSCITSRWDTNCGSCYACIARMIGSADLKLSLNYFKENSLVKSGNDMFISLINFCFDFFSYRENLDYWSLENIMRHGKEDLFKRHCLDVFLALKNLNDARLLHSDYLFFLEKALSSYGAEVVLREKNFEKIKTPDFSSMVS